MKRQTFSWVVTALVLTAGCVSPTAPPAAGIATGEALETDRPVVLDDSLQRRTLLGHRVKILVEDPIVRPGPAGTREYSVLLRNVTDFDQHLQARAHYLGDAHQETEAPSPWEMIFIPANSIATYRAVPTEAISVTSFYVELRKAR